MPSFDRIRDRLPYLYRPEDGDDSLLTIWLQAIGTVLDRFSRESNDVMRAHWYEYADQASLDAFFLRTRILQKAAPLVPPPSDPSVAAFPYIQDLARLATVLPVLPWQQPADAAELVEEYRLRIRRIVEVYRDGLGAIGSIRGMVEAQLPAHRGVSKDQQDRPFQLEEFAPAAGVLLRVPPRGEPLDLVGPLMRWTIDNDGVAPAPLAVYIQGVAVQDGLVDATSRPLIECYESAGRRCRVGVGYLDTIAPDQALRLRPKAQSWIGRANGVWTAESLPPEGQFADPTAPGPWTASAGGPGAAVVAIRQTADLTLWAAVNAGGAGELHAFDGAAWSAGPATLPPIRCLAEDGGDLLIGCDNGLLRMPLHPAGGTLTPTPVAAFAGHRVNALFRDSTGELWLGCDNGAFTLGAADAAAPSPLQNCEVFAIAQDQGGALYFGNSAGLVQWQPGGPWHVYDGQDGVSWKEFTPPAAPPAGFLPPVISIRRGRDAGLWIGAQSGLARYTGYDAGNRQFEARLEAFPDLGGGPISAIEEDARGIVWFATARGLFRYDGRDVWQFRGSSWVQMGRADTLYAPDPADRGIWRFNRATSQWETFNTNWIPFTAAARSTAEPAVAAIAWTTGVTADLGSWDGAKFSNPSPADATKLVARYKPSEDRIVAGGIPGFPPLPPGASVWRYLSVEPESLTPPADRPWWTQEGRLLLPSPRDDAPGEGRYDVEAPPPPSDFDETVYPYNPAAAVWFEWRPSRPLSVLVRLRKLAPGETIDPAVTARVLTGARQVRPAGVRVEMAVEENPVSST